MIVLNCSHPLTPAQIAGIEALSGQTIERVIAIPSQVDAQSQLAPQIVRMADAAGLSAEQWQTAPLLLVAPALNFSAATLLAEIHGRAGYFVPMLRLRPVAGSLPPQYEVAEIVCLSEVRGEARAKRAHTV